MQVDTLRLAFTYTIALVIVIGGGILLVVPSQVPPEQLLPFMTGIVGTVIGFVFQRESSSGAARQTERAFATGAASQPTVTTTSGPPSTATVTPAAPVSDEGGLG